MVTVPAGRKESPLDLSQEESDSRYLYRHYLTQHSQLPLLIQSGSAKKTESTTSWLGRRFMGGKPPVNPKIRACPKTSRPRWIHRKDNSPTLRQEAEKTDFSLRRHLVPHWRAPGLQAAVVAGQAYWFLASAYKLLQFVAGGFHGDVHEQLLGFPLKSTQANCCIHFFHCDW